MIGNDLKIWNSIGDCLKQQAVVKQDYVADPIQLRQQALMMIEIGFMNTQYIETGN